MTELKQQIAKLEEALVAETRRRVDATTQLDDQARQQIYDMETRLRTQLENDNDALQQRVSQLETRLAALEERWNQEATQQIEIVAQKSATFQESLHKIQQEHDMERKSRLRREGSLLEQVETHAREFQERWKSERQDRMDQIKRLEEMLSQKEGLWAKEQASFQRRVEEELELLRMEMDTEVQERQAQDEVLAAALNRYNQQLQHSLSILSQD